MEDFLAKMSRKIFEDREYLQQELKKTHSRKKMVFTNGCFDLLHGGHVEYLAQARMLGDYLVVGLNSDESVTQIKGAERPIKDWKERAKILSGLACIDFVVNMPEINPVDLILYLEPPIHCKGGDYKDSALEETSAVASYGGSVKILQFVNNLSTTQLIERIRISI